MVFNAFGWAEPKLFSVNRFTIPDQEGILCNKHLSEIKKIGAKYYIITNILVLR